MANIRFLANDGHKDAAVFASSSASSLPVTNTRNANNAKIWRSVDDPYDSPSVDALEQVIDSIMPVTIDGPGGFVIRGTNFTTDAVLSLVLKNGGGTVDTVEPVCLDANFDGTTDWRVWFDDGPINQFSLSISDPTNPAGYLQAIQIMCGPYITVEYNMTSGAEIEYAEDIEHIITKGQSPRSFGTDLIKRIASIDFSIVSDTDRIAVIDTLISAGMRNPVFLSMYPEVGSKLELHHQFVSKRITNINTQHTHLPWWTQAIQFREV